VGPAGAKAKWVRVELKKIETLPGGGQANSYFDHVGPSPISLWQSSEDYSVLQSVRDDIRFRVWVLLMVVAALTARSPLLDSYSGVHTT